MTSPLPEQVLSRMERSQSTYDLVPRADGNLLRWIVETSKRCRVLEVGSAIGYSAICLGLGLQHTGGRVLTIERDRDMSDLCRDNLRKAGLEKTVECVTGDALNVIPELDDCFDFLFVDLAVDVLPFFKVAEPKLSGDYLMALHNLSFAGIYRSFVNYALARGLRIREVKPHGGYGFFLISPMPLDWIEQEQKRSA